MDINIPFVLFLIVIISNWAAYQILKEEKGVKSILELYFKRNNLELSVFILKAALGLIPVRNKLAIWICRIVYILFIVLFLAVLLVRFF
ncbi:hypothetical protein PT286_10145 [Neisseriaceae bacterium ESL0693]|nr:hypothetical protein [Neisseriaceae bacterium ESL0693]